MNGKDYLIIIGAPKCGTTSLAEWLGQLPDTAVARDKETLYFTDYPARRWTGPGFDFASRGVSTDAAFEAQFAHAPDAQLRVEASTDNLSCPISHERIEAFRARSDVRSVKLVAVLRDPVKRIVSSYEHTLKLGWQTDSLMSALRAEPKRTREGWHPLFHPIERSRYFEQLAPYRAAFGDDLLILDFHTLSDPETLPRLAAFAGRGDGLLPTQLEQRNAREVYAHPKAERLLLNAGALALARGLVPRRFRAGIRALLRGKPQERYEPRAEEIAFIVDALADDIAACRADPAIPTDNWTCCPGIGRAARRADPEIPTDHLDHPTAA